jgi:hypothetical protein
LTRSIGVGVDREQASQFGGNLEQVVWRVLAFRPAVDLDGDAVLPAGGEHSHRIELRFRPAPSEDYPPVER